MRLAKISREYRTNPPCRTDGMRGEGLLWVGGKEKIRAINVSYRFSSLPEEGGGSEKKRIYRVKTADPFEKSTLCMLALLPRTDDGVDNPRAAEAEQCAEQKAAEHVGRVVYVEVKA